MITHPSRPPEKSDSPAGPPRSLTGTELLRQEHVLTEYPG